MTIKDVGAEAGVSWTTVSRVLGGRRLPGHVSPETRARVISAAAKLGYRRNASGVALKRGFTESIALLAVGWDVTSTHARIITRLTGAAESRGLSATIHIAGDDRKVQSLLDAVRHPFPFGIALIWDSDEIPLDDLAELRSEGVPVIDLLPPLPGGPVSVTWDRREGIRNAVRHLITLGHREIVLAMPMRGTPRSTGSKLEGFKLGLAEAGLRFDNDLILAVESNYFKHGYDGLNALVEARPEVTAVMCTDDRIAAGVAAAARDRDMSVPADLSVTGYGAQTSWHLIPPQLTTLVAGATPIAEQAVSYMMQIRDDPDCTCQNVCEPMALIVGESTGPVRTSC